MEFNITKESLRDALLILLDEGKTLDQISITSLCKKAGVSRMAYYRHYTSMTELYYDLIEHFLNQFLKNNINLISSQNWDEFWLSFFTYLYKHQQEVKIIIQSDQQTILLQYLNHLFFPNNIQVNSFEKYEVLGIVGLTFNIINAWVDDDFEQTPEYLASICQSLLTISTKKS